MSELDFAKIEKKWQDRWEEEKIFEVSEESKKEKYYVLEMFPYPSGDGLHMGHALNYTIGDVFARFKRMNNFNVLYPMGYDALGLPAENAAIKAGTHPKDYTDNSIKNFIRQQKALGISYDWTRVVNTADPNYYKWDQWIFLKLLEKNLAYQKESSVNWCPKCDTVLANEQVQGGMCWRHDDTKVEVKTLKQWFFKITDYADELYESIDTLENWPKKTKAMQKNWIGKSYGTEINFEINGNVWPVFTTRPDTIYGVTFVVVAANHKKLMELVTKEQEEKVKNFLSKISSVSEKDMENLEKEGVFTGSYATNPVNGEKVPVYAGNFVLAEYGSGMVMAVPAHDQRDFEFAKKYEIKIKQVIDGEITDKRAYTEEGVLINSNKFNGINSNVAIKKISEYLEKENKGKRVVNFKLRDWGVSRQRYWGTPIPVIHCEKCGAVPVPEKELPVTLPKDVKFGKGNPLTTNEDWIKTKCPKCGEEARRETDTMDTFVNSSWYFLRYTDANNNEKIFDESKANYWAPIDQYIGGAEHACMHLIYIRFYTKFLADLGLINFREPAKKLFHQGMLNGEGGVKMSKSKGNVVNPDLVSKEYGIDSSRIFLLSLAAPDKPRDWSDKGIIGSKRFIERIYNYFKEVEFGSDSEIVLSKLNRTIKELTEEIPEFKYNLSVIKIRQLFESFEEEKISKDTANKFIRILSPFTPHLAEELWEIIKEKGFVSTSNWPDYYEKKINLALERTEEYIENIRKDILKIKELAKIEKVKSVKIFVCEQWKWKALELVQVITKERFDFSESMQALMSEEEMKKQGKNIQNFLKSLNTKQELLEIERFDEEKFIENAKEKLESEFGKIEVIPAEKSSEAKAKNAMPAKPALIVE